MEDVLEVYQRPYDGNEVLVCMDETSKQQVKETRVPRPAAPGLSAAYDYEYERNGVSSLFMLFAPLDGWRRVEVRERRTKVDWAHVIKKLVDEDYPDRDRIVLVMDNLNTHKLSSLYEASSGPHHQDSGESKIRESTAGGSRKPSSDGKACGCSSKHLCGLTAWNT